MLGCLKTEACNIPQCTYRLDRASTVGIVFFVILLVCTLVTMRWSDRKVNYDA